MAGSSELEQEVIDGVTVYRITSDSYDEKDYQGDVYQEALQRMRKSGWWGEKGSVPPSDKLKPEDLSAVLQKKSGRSHSELSSNGVYMYLKKGDNKIFIGSAIYETLLERQQKHLSEAAYTSTDDRLGLDKSNEKFDQQLSRQYDESNWHFYAIPMSSSDPEKIREKEKELIGQYKAKEHGYNV